MKDLSDKGAVCYRRYLNGDESAVDDIMRELFFSLVCFVEHYVHDIPAAEDIAMDVMSDLFLNKHRYNFKVSLKTYVFMRGKSRALDLIRHRKALPVFSYEDAASYGDELFDLEDRLVSDERKRAVHGAIEKLPEEMREAVYLIYFEELSYEEIAKQLNIPLGTVKIQLRRARMLLAEIIKPQKQSL